MHTICDPPNFTMLRARGGHADLKTTPRTGSGATDHFTATLVEHDVPPATVGHLA
jgi:hypothetical protein